MSENTITCPKCATIINLDEAQAKKYNEDLQRNEEKLKADFEKQKVELKNELEKEREKDKKEMWVKALKAAEEKKELETKDLNLQLEEFKKKQEEAIKNELELRKKTRELEDKARNIELENIKKLDEERKKMEEKMKEEQKKKEEEMFRKIQEDQSKQMAEKDKQMDILRRSLEEANRKALQGSQQIQWEIQENELKEILSRNFPSDSIEDVPTWIKWADLIQTVRNHRWQQVWIILWESKNTKTWSNEWIKKLKDDRIIVKADVCVIVSNTMPDEIKHFWTINDVVITEFAYFLAVTSLLRDKLIALHLTSNSLVWKDEKMDLLFNYLSSNDFKSKIENIVWAFKSLKDDIDSEKRSMMRIWSKREKELERVINNTIFMWWDLEWIMGNNLQKIPYLELWSWEDNLDAETI
ncbi:MAG: hypothetical protein ACD_3C00037G0027 [uncultured bacterium (gcode 4)]|uniref:DUF2130 domain-containing protein n=1 Tax=uncultured bacterium (gcode 4) TaxID=1234023 RepID=K2FC80_9BACT|nr:MAG: hypothetical protein ACD_3C00037G0027 [uncultured bacterium (gcode 4)]